MHPPKSEHRSSFPWRCLISSLQLAMPWISDWGILQTISFQDAHTQLGAPSVPRCFGCWWWRVSIHIPSHESFVLSFWMFIIDAAARCRANALDSKCLGLKPHSGSFSLVPLRPVSLLVCSFFLCNTAWQSVLAPVGCTVSIVFYKRFRMLPSSYNALYFKILISQTILEPFRTILLLFPKSCQWDFIILPEISYRHWPGGSGMSQHAKGCRFSEVYHLLALYLQLACLPAGGLILRLSPGSDPWSIPVI